MPGRLIRFGNFSLLYEDGFVRYVRSGPFEIIRMIYFALRDSNWVTAGISRSDENISVNENGFEITYTATNIAGGRKVFRWDVKISGNSKGEIVFSVDGQALGKYSRNRAGICVLHPIRETVNKAVEITRPDKTVYKSKFPATISPHQPFLDITRMKWQLEGNAWAELRFEGDIFETEDQRNWSDTSFKTYSTPLSIPFPVLLNPGDRVIQKVTLSIAKDGTPPVSTPSKDVEITIDETRTSVFPKIGAEFPGRGLSSHKDIGLLVDLGLEHLRIEIVFNSATWKEHLEEGLSEAAAISAHPFLHLVFGNDAGSEWDLFVKQLTKDQGKSVSKLAISPMDRKASVDELLRAILPKARSWFPHASIGAGFRSYFTELNRNRFDYGAIDFVIYTVNPQVHANDSHTIIENLPAQYDTVRSAVTFAEGRKVHVGPVSLRPRFNPDAMSESNGDVSALPYRFDVRQVTPLAAGWTMGSIKYLAEGGADSITLFEAHGMAGYFFGDDDWKHKEFHTDMKIFPVYDALIALRKLKPSKIIRSECSQPLVCSSLLLDGDNGRYLVLVNHTDVGIMVKVRDKVYTVNGWEISITSFNK